MSARENIAKIIVQQIENMTSPSFAHLSREKFDIEKLAITQFPACLIVTTNEDREDLSMSERQSIIRYQLRCFVRGNQIDTLRNELVEGIEETLEKSRNRDITLASTNIHNVTTHITNIEVVDRELPLGEVIVNVDVIYTYTKGVL